MMICMLDSLLLYRKGHLGLFPRQLLISHRVPVLPGINPGSSTTAILNVKTNPRLTEKKKRKKRKLKKIWEGAIFAKPP